MIIKKKDIEKLLKENNQLKELVGGDIYSDGGDEPVGSPDQIETGPQSKDFNDNSTYEKGTPTTTDKVVSRYTQDLPWFATYNFNR